MEIEVRAWFVWINDHTAGVLYLGKRQMDWLKQRVQAGKLDLPDAVTSERGCPVSAKLIGELRSAMVDREIAERAGDDIAITPDAARGILKARASQNIPARLMDDLTDEYEWSV